LPARLGRLGPVVWNNPTALSVLCRYRHSTDYADARIMPISVRKARSRW
jgi:hypothetical protein